MTRRRPSTTALAAIGGRFGPRRTTSSRENRTRTARPVCVGELARRARHRRRLLAAERTTVRERRGRLATGCAPRRVRLEVGGLDPRRGEPHAARRASAAAGGAASARPSCAGPAPSPRGRAPRAATRRRPTRARPRIVDGASEPGGSGTATSASRGAVSSAKPPRPSGTSRPTRWATPPSSSARRAAAPSPIASLGRPMYVGRNCRRGRTDEGLGDGLPAGAAAEVGGKGSLDVGERGLPLGVERGGAHDDARACRTRTARRRSRRARRRAGRAPRVEPLDGGDDRPSTRATGVTHATLALAVDEHGATPALALRRAAVLRRGDARGARAGPTAATRRARPPDRPDAVAGERRPMTSRDHDRAG